MICRIARQNQPSVGSKQPAGDLVGNAAPSDKNGPVTIN